MQDQLPQEEINVNQILAKHAKTFYFASLWLNRSVATEAAQLYAFCRYIDDVVDESVASPETIRKNLLNLSNQLLTGRSSNSYINLYLTLSKERGVKIEYALHLIDGVISDLGSVRLKTDEELIKYCFRVASTVGLMMCPLLGVRDLRALPFAIHLGIAMQITNICRDVAEDLERDRVYLPQSRLGADSIAAASTDVCLESLSDAQLKKIQQVIQDLLDLADRYYNSAALGMCFIPRRSRLSIMIASRVYRAIGLNLRKRGCDPRGGRVFVSVLGKVYWMVFACAEFIFPRFWSLPSNFKKARYEPDLHRSLNFERPQEGLPLF